MISNAFEDLGLVRTTPYVVGRTRTSLVTLTSEGRAVLEQGRRPGAAGTRQPFYVGISKPRELAHDCRTMTRRKRLPDHSLGEALACVAWSSKRN